MPLLAAGEVQSAAAARQASPAEHVLACPNMLKLRAAMERARAANRPLVICRLPGSMDEGAHPGCLVLPGAVLQALEMQVGCTDCTTCSQRNQGEYSMLHCLAGAALGALDVQVCWGA